MGVSGERLEQAIGEFEKICGKLEAWVIPEIPGWSFQTKYLPVSGQTHVTYYSPEDKPYGTVRAVEGCLGIRLLNGEMVGDMIEQARQAFIQKHGTQTPDYNPLRRTADGSTLQEA